MKTLQQTVSPVSAKLVKLVAVLFLGTSFVTGCASTGDQYAWSHDMSGDYLFAYDQNQCSDQAAGNTSAPEFFGCMESLGYYLIDPATGAPVAALNAGVAEAVAEQASL